MPNEMQELFLLATRFFYKKYKKDGGSQGALAIKLGITNSYLSSVISGARKASLELQSQIAHILYGPYDKFLAIGRKIKEGHDPLEEEPEQPFDSVERLLAQLTHYILDHQRIERELQISREKYRDISLTSGDMIFEVDPDLTITYASGRVQEVMERDANELIGRKFSDFIDATELARIQALITESIRKKTIIDTVITITEGREVKYRHAVAKPVFSPKNEFRGFRGTYRDITRRKILEKALEQQNWLLQVAIDSIDHCAIVISDADNTVLKWNMEYKRLFNHSEKVLKTRDTLEYIAETKIKALDPEQYERDIKKVLKSRKAVTHTYKLRDGKIIERKVIPLYKDGVLIGRIAHIRDIAKEGPAVSN